MPRSVLEAVLSLNTRQFQRALSRAKAEAAEFAKRGLQALAVGATAAGAALVVGTKRVLAMGGALSDLKANAGVAVKDLMILQQALKANGVEASKAGPAIARMQKTIVDAADGIKESRRALIDLGLSVEDLAGMSTVDQFRTIGQRLAAIEDPAIRASVAMRIFGKSGAEMIAAFTDTGAINDAVATLGRMPAIMDRFAGAFDRVDDILGNLPIKADQFFTGFASELVGTILGPLEEVNKMDFTQLGQRLGAAIRPWLETVKNGDIWEIFALYAEKAAVSFAGHLMAAGVNAAYAIGAAMETALDMAVQAWKQGMGGALAMIGKLYNDTALPGPLGSLQRATGDAITGAAAGIMPVDTETWGQAYQRNRSGYGDSSITGATGRATGAIQSEIDALLKGVKGLGEANKQAAADIGASSGNASGSLNTLDRAAANLAKSLAEKFGFTVDEAAAGTRGGPESKWRAKEVKRKEDEAQRLRDQAAEYDSLGNDEAAKDYRERANKVQSEADEMRNTMPGLKPSERPSTGQEGVDGTSSDGGNQGNPDVIRSNKQALGLNDPGPRPSDKPQPASPTEPKLDPSVSAIVDQLKAIASKLTIGPAGI